MYYLNKVVITNKIGVLNLLGPGFNWIEFLTDK